MIDRRNILKASGVAAIAAALPTSAGGRARAEERGEMGNGTFTADGLARFDRTMKAHVESGEVPGLVALLHRHGETHVMVAGKRRPGGPAMTRDTIFRIASLTKPVTAAAAMMLVEDGTLSLDEPVDPWLPELADRRVLTSIEAPLDQTVPAKRPITLRDLLSQRFGLGAIMIWPSEYPIQFAMEERGVAPSAVLFDGTPEEYMRRLGELPLVHQPGEGWLYDTGMHVTGVLLARASGKSLGDLLRERVFEPLGMGDTGFFVPPESVDRLATMFWKDFEVDRLVVFDEAAGGRFASPPDFESGSGGLVSTVDNYLAFYRMMLAGGEHEGKRLLSRASVEEMRRDQLSAEQRASAELFLEGQRGWGLGMAVALTRTDTGQSPGTFGWNGGYGLDGHADPEKDLIGLLFTQRMMDSPEPPPHFADFWRAAYRSIEG